MSDIEEAEMESAEAEAVEVIKLEAEIDRLRAELAFMRGHGIVQDNERLLAELAEAKLERDTALTDLVKAELAEANARANMHAANVEHWKDLAKRLCAELTAAKARIAALQGGAERYWEGRWREADARIAELETERAKLSSFHDMLTKLSHALARAEKAEADCKRAEAERDALRVALKPFADEYDPDLPFWSCRDDNSMLMWDGLASDLCRGDFIRARAALAPSPAGREG